MTHVECIWSGRAELGESPIWVAAEGALYWVDIEQARLFRRLPGRGRTKTWQWKSRLTSIAPGKNGQFVGTFEDAFVLLDLKKGRAEKLPAPEKTLPQNRFNDGKLDPNGNFWAGTMDEKEARPSGALYRLNAELRCEKMDDGYRITNGPAFSLDGRRMYCADSAAGIVFQMDLNESGDICGKKPFLEFSQDMGLPDGMTVDSEDCLWVCHWGGWRVTRFAPSGQTLSEIFLPVCNVTSCCFGSADLDVLYITTARQRLGAASLRQQPLAGGVFACAPGVKGVPSPHFAGQEQG